MNQQSYLLEAKDLRFSYETAPHVIKGISLCIHPGERIVFLGGNGEGKSTLFYLLAGLYAPESGKIYLDGERMNASRELPAHQRKKMGFLFQEAEDQILGATIYEDVSFGPMNLKLPEEEVRQRVKKAIEFFGLEGLEDHPTHYLSGGQKKRLSLASTLVMEPRILFCDEPFNSLDHEMKKRVEDYLWNYSQKGNTVLLSSHDVDFAWRFATRIILVHDGEILLDKNTEEFFKEKDLLLRYGLSMPLLIELAEQFGMNTWPKTISEVKNERV